eukprot:1683426-Rhodomonas_salina.1
MHTRFLRTTHTHAHAQQHLFPPHRTRSAMRDRVESAWVESEAFICASVCLVVCGFGTGLGNTHDSTT